MYHPEEDRADNSLEPVVCVVAEVFLLKLHDRRQGEYHHDDEWYPRGRIGEEEVDDGSSVARPRVELPLLHERRLGLVADRHLLFGAGLVHMMQDEAHDAPHEDRVTALQSDEHAHDADQDHDAHQDVEWTDLEVLTQPEPIAWI